MITEESSLLFLPALNINKETVLEGLGDPKVLYRGSLLMCGKYRIGNPKHR